MRSLAGARVLVIEDESLVATLIEAMLTDLGCEIAGSAWRLAQGLALAQSSTADIAILDVNLAGERVFPIAEALMRRSIPFAFATGYGTSGIPPHLAHIPTLAKPFRQDDLRRTLERALALSAEG